MFYLYGITEASVGDIHPRSYRFYIHHRQERPHLLNLLLKGPILPRRKFKLLKMGNCLWLELNLPILISAYQGRCCGGLDVDVVAARGLDLPVDRIIIRGPYILWLGGIITVIMQHKYYWQRSVMRGWWNSSSCCWSQWRCTRKFIQIKPT